MSRQHEPKRGVETRLDEGLNWMLASLAGLQALLTMAVPWADAPAGIARMLSFHAAMLGLGMCWLALCIGRGAAARGQRRALARRTVRVVIPVCSVALGVAAWLKIAALGYPATVFGLQPLPVLDFMPDLARAARRWHDLLAFALLAALALDAGGAVTDALRRRQQMRGAKPKQSRPDKPDRAGRGQSE